jgi:hypothetical protein
MQDAAGGARARTEQGQDAAVAGVPAKRDSREQAAGAVREAMDAARAMRRASS